MDRSALEQKLAELPIAQYLFFHTDELEFSPRIRTVCEQELSLIHISEPTRPY